MATSPSSEVSSAGIAALIRSGDAGALAKVNARLAESAGPADSYHTKVRALGDSTKVLSGDNLRLQQALLGVQGDLDKGAESYKRTEGASKGAAAGAV